MTTRKLNATSATAHHTKTKRIYKMMIDNYKDLPEYAVAEKVWDDIFNNNTLIYDKFEEYFYHEFYKSSASTDKTNRYE